MRAMEHRDKPLFASSSAARPAAKRRLFAVALPAAAGAVLVAVFLAFKPAASDAAGPRRVRLATVVRVAEATRTVPLSGSLRFSDVGAVVAPEAGIVAEIRVRAGDVVKRGQPMLELESRELAEARSAAEAAARETAAEIGLRRAKAAIDADRLGRLAETARASAARAASRAEADAALSAKGLLSADAASASLLEARRLSDEAASAAAGRDFAEREAAVALEGLESKLDASRRRIAELDARLSSCRIASPRDALVTSVDPKAARRGAYVERYAPLLEYSDVSTAEVALALPIRWMSAVAIGDRVAVNVGGRATEAVVERVGALGGSGAGGDTVELVARLRETPPLAVSGQKVDARLVAERMSDLLALPDGPYVSSGRLSVVYVADGAVARRKEAKLSPDWDCGVAVLEGLAEGDLVVVSSYEAFDGQAAVPIQGE